MKSIFPTCLPVLAGLLAMPIAGLHTADTVAPPAANTQTANSTDNGSLDKRDAQFMRKAAMCAQAEIQMSEMAAKRNLVDEDKAFAKKMQDAHRTVQSELEKLAKAKGVTLPTNLDEKTQKKGKELASTADKDFAEDYLECQITAHKEAIDLYEDAADDANDPEVRAFAARNLPSLHAHLAEARQLEKKY